jgi:hypothetical protein
MWRLGIYYWRREEHSFGRSGAYLESHIYSKPIESFNQHSANRRESQAAKNVAFKEYPTPHDMWMECLSYKQLNQRSTQVTTTTWTLTSLKREGKKLLSYLNIIKELLIIFFSEKRLIIWVWVRGNINYINSLFSLSTSIFLTRNISKQTHAIHKTKPHAFLSLKGLIFSLKFKDVL